MGVVMFCPLYPLEREPIPIVQEAGGATRDGLGGCRKSLHDGGSIPGPYSP
jgi:hypothetical protein